METDRGRLDQWMIRTGTFPSGALTTEGDGPETVIGCARQALDIDSDNMVWPDGCLTIPRRSGLAHMKSLASVEEPSPG